MLSIQIKAELIIIHRHGINQMNLLALFESDPNESVTDSRVRMI